MRIGAAIIDVTPPPGLAMTGYAARKLPAERAHDSLTVRAMVVDDTALVAVDALGLTARFCERVRAALPLPAGNAVIHATHTHGGPFTMPGRLLNDSGTSYMGRLEGACVHAVQNALQKARKGNLHLVAAKDPGVAKNRRRPGGPVDRSLSMLVARDENQRPIACLVNHACHPVVLGADNLSWTADYPHYVRQRVEKTHPGAVAVYLTGCVGDVSVGHSAADSFTARPQKGRDFATAKAIGGKIATALSNQGEMPLHGPASVRNAQVEMGFARREKAPLRDLAKRWRQEEKVAPPPESDLLRCWVAWAEMMEQGTMKPITGRVTALRWGGLTLLAMPGEIFAQTALEIRERLGGEALMLAGFCEDNPGYIPHASEYDHGGYEVDEAHRYYGMPATFAMGTAEAIAEKAVSLAAC